VRPSCAHPTCPGPAEQCRAVRPSCAHPTCPGPAEQCHVALDFGPAGAKPVKHSSDKPRLSLAMGPGFVEIGKAMTYGAQKYSAHNYSNGGGLPRLDLIDAAARHIAAYVDGVDVDSESGLHHLAHAGASILMALDLIARSKGEDGRYQRKAKR